MGEFLSQNIIGLPLALSQFLSFLGIAVLLLLAFRALRSVVGAIVKIEWHAFINSVGGFIAGVARSFLTVSLVLVLLILLPLPYMQWSIKDRSLTGLFFLKIGPIVYAKTHKFIPGLKTRGGLVDANALIDELTSEKTLALERKKEKSETPQGE